MNDDLVYSSRFAEDRDLIRSWLIRSLLKSGVWGASVDGLLVALRTAIRDDDSDGFPYESLAGSLASRGRPLTFDRDELEAAIENPRHHFTLLSLLYPGARFNESRFHIDHVFPQARFSRSRLTRSGVPWEDVETFLQRKNCLPNLQLLNDRENQAKSAAMPLEWLDKAYPNEAERRDLVARHDLGELPPAMTGFNRWYEAVGSACWNV